VIGTEEGKEGSNRQRHQSLGGKDSLSRAAGAYPAAKEVAQSFFV